MRLQPTVSFWPTWNATFFLPVALGGEQVDANHRSPALLQREADRDGRGRRDASASSIPSFAASNVIVLNGSNVSTGAPKRSSSAAAKPSTRDAPPLRRIRSMRSGRGRRLEEVERLLDLEQHVLGHRVQHRLDVLDAHAVDRLPLLQLLGAVERQVQFFLHRFGVRVAAHRDVAGEQRLVAAQDVDVDRARARVQQHDTGSGRGRSSPRRRSAARRRRRRRRPACGRPGR